MTWGFSTSHKQQQQQREHWRDEAWPALGCTQPLHPTDVCHVHSTPGAVVLNANFYKDTSRNILSDICERPWA